MGFDRWPYYLCLILHGNAQELTIQQLTIQQLSNLQPTAEGGGGVEAATGEEPLNCLHRQLQQGWSRRE
jgi:hypothetical protein